MEFNNPNFVSFMQTNYNTIRVSFLAANPMGPTLPVRKFLQHQSTLKANNHAPVP